MNDWTVETLKTYFEALLVERDKSRQEQLQHILALLAEKDKAIQAAMASADRAVNKAETATEKRFEGVNEMRQMVETVLKTTMAKSEAVIRLDRLDKENEELRNRQAAIEGKGRGFTGGWGVAVGVVGLVAVVVSIIIAVRGLTP